MKKTKFQINFFLKKTLHLSTGCNFIANCFFSKQGLTFGLFFKLSLLVCVGCAGGHLNHLGFSKDSGSELLSFRQRGLYSASSLAVSLSQSTFLTKGLSKRESGLFSLAGLVLSDQIKKYMIHFLDIKFEKVKGYRVKYVTVDPYRKTERIEVSGLVLVPSEHYSLPLLAYFHPTLLRKNQAPSLISPSLLSSDPFTDDRIMMILLALQGYIVFAPDYVGYGSSENNIHPYLYKPAVSQTAKSLLNALESALDEQHIPFKRDLFIAGYSQGGHGALAFAESMQKNPMDFSIKAVFAGGGPYDLLYTIRQQLDKQTFSKIMLALSSLLLQSYSYIYRWNLDDIVRRNSYSDVISSVFKYDDLLSSVRGLPAKPNSLFRSQFLEEIQDKDDRYNPFSKPLEQNSVYDWTPDFPILLYHGREDDIVPYNNMRIAGRALNGRRGHKVKTKDCNFEKVRDLISLMNKVNNRQMFTKTTSHLNCLFMSFLEINSYFSQYY